MSADATQTDSEALERLLPPPSEEELSAQASSRNWVIFTIVWAIVTSLATAWFAWVVWRKDSGASDITQRRYGLATALALRATGELEKENLSLKTRLTEHDKQVAELTKAASDAMAAQQRVELELASQQQRTEELRANNLETELRLEKERAERIELEKAVAPRSLRATSETTARLRKFKGTPVVIEFASNDHDAERLARYIYGEMEQAQWDVRQVTRATNLLPDGIVVEVERGGPEKDEFGDTARAAIQLGEFLEANDLDVRVSPHAAWRTAESDKPLLISVGSKPTWAFFDRERTAAWEAERDKRWEEWVDALPPQLRDLNKMESPVKLKLETTKERRERLKREWFPPMPPMPSFPIPPKE